MAIRFEPKSVLRRLTREKVIKRLVTNRLTLNRAVLSQLAELGVLKKSTLERIALKVIKDYKRRFREGLNDGLSETKAKAEALSGRKQMVQRVQNSIVHEISNDVKSKYRGEFYTWLPSDADEPDPIHQLNYGKRFQLGRGEQPGDRYGCKCGMEIHVNESRLKL